MRLKFPVLFLVIAFLSPLALATHLNVTLVSPPNALNTTSPSLNFVFVITVQNDSVADGVDNFTGAWVWLANTTNLPASVPGVYWGVNRTANATLIGNGSQITIPVAGLSRGRYLWNVNVSTNSSSNFSAFNRTFVIDDLGPSVVNASLMDQGAQLGNFGMPANNVTFPLPIGRRFAKPVVNFTTFRIAVSDFVGGSGVASVQIRNASAANGNPGAWVQAALSSGGIFDGLWVVTINISNASDGFVNFTINITDFAGNSTLRNLTGTNQHMPEFFVEQSRFGFPAQANGEYFINNFPVIQGRVIDLTSGTTLTNANPASYNVTIFASRIEFGMPTATTFNNQYRINADGEYILVFNESSARPSFGGQGGAPPSMYRYYAIVNGTNRNVSHVSAFTMPQPVGFMAAPGRPAIGRNLYVSPAVTVVMAAQNSTMECSSFFGMVMDGSSGVPLRFIDNQSTNGPCTLASWVEVFLPANKNYSFTIVNPPTPNSIALPFPPRTMQITTQNVSDSDVTDFNGSKINVSINTSFTMVTLNGSLIVNNGTLSTPGAVIANGSVRANLLNYTKFESYMSFSGFVPPMEPAGSRNVTQLNASGNYSIQVPSGVTYTLYAYASDTATNTHYMGIVQVSPTTNTHTNITLYRLAGAFPRASSGMGGEAGPGAPPGEGGYEGGRSGGFNTSMTQFRFVNENGTLISDTSNPNSNQMSGSDINAEIETNYSGALVRRQHRSQSGATINVPLLRGEPVKVRVYAMNYYPLERTYDGALITANETINITMKRPEMRPPRQGGVENDTLITSAKVEFLISNSTCNTPNYPASCRMDHLRQEGSNASSFKSDEQMISGVVNIVITDTSTNVTTMLVGMDLSSTSMPNMEMDAKPFEQGDVGDNKVRTRRVGSFVPPGMVQAIWVGNPLNTSEVNPNASSAGKSNISIDIPYLYDDDGNLQWNASRNSTTQMPGKYADYVNEYAGHAINNTNLSGIGCWMSYNSSIKCWVDNNTQSPKAWLKLPHFSTVGVQVAAPATSSSSSSSSPGSSGGSSGGGSGGSLGGNIVSYPTTPPGPKTTGTSAASTPTPIPTTTLKATPSPAPQPAVSQIAQQTISSAQQAIEAAAGRGVSEEVLSEARRLLARAQELASQGESARAEAFANEALALLSAIASPAATPPSTVRSGEFGFDSTAIGGIVAAIVIIAALAYAMSEKKTKK